MNPLSTLTWFTLDAKDSQQLDDSQQQDESQQESNVAVDGTPRGDGHRTMESPASTEKTDSSGVVSSGTATPLSTLPKPSPSPEHGKWVSNYYSRQYENDDDDDGPCTGASDTTLVLGQSSPAASEPEPSPLPVEDTKLDSLMGSNDDEDSESETNTVKSEHISPLNLDSQFQQAESGEQAESGSSDVDDPELDEQVALPQWIVWTIVCCLCVCMRDTQPCAFHTSQLVLKGNQNQG